MNNLDKKVQSLFNKGKKALVPFITGGYPSLEKSKEILKTLENAGADIIEVGIPFSDPLADGEVISKSYYDALKEGVKPLSVLNMVKEFKENSETPIVIMVYYNIIFSIGEERFLKRLKECKVDGLIVPDIPLEERGELISLCNEYEISLIPLVAPTSNERLGMVLEGGRGFAYCVSKRGTTGNSLTITNELKEYLGNCENLSNVPCYLGFGINSKETVRNVKSYTSGVIIGSAIVKIFLEEEDFSKAIERLQRFVVEIKEELK